MISKATYKFLRDLKANNNRDWFQENKPRYEAAKAEFEGFITALYGEISKFDDSIGLIEPKKTIFRIYRDVRFSKSCNFSESETYLSRSVTLRSDNNLL